MRPCKAAADNFFSNYIFLGSTDFSFPAYISIASPPPSSEADFGLGTRAQLLPPEIQFGDFSEPPLKREMEKVRKTRDRPLRSFVGGSEWTRFRGFLVPSLKPGSRIDRRNRMLKEKCILKIQFDTGGRRVSLGVNRYTNHK
jgi:hypothetical protein